MRNAQHEETNLETKRSFRKEDFYLIMAKIKREGSIRVWQEKRADANVYEHKLTKSRLGTLGVNFIHASFDGVMFPVACLLWQQIIRRKFVTTNYLECLTSASTIEKRIIVFKIHS